MARRAQTQLIFSELARDRSDSLALSLGEARAEILRRLIEDALPRMEEAYAEQLAELDQIAEGMGLTRLELAARATRDKLTLSDLRGRKRYPRKA